MNANYCFVGLCLDEDFYGHVVGINGRIDLEFYVIYLLSICFVINSYST